MEINWNGRLIFDLLAEIAAKGPFDDSDLADISRTNIPQELDQDISNKIIACDESGYCLLADSRDVLPYWKIVSPNLKPFERPLVYKGQVLHPITADTRCVGYIAHPHEEYTASFLIEKYDSTLINQVVYYSINRLLGSKKTINNADNIRMEDAISIYHADISQLGFINEHHDRK